MARERRFFGREGQRSSQLPLPEYATPQEINRATRGVEEFWTMVANCSTPEQADYLRYSDTGQAIKSMLMGIKPVVEFTWPADREAVKDLPFPDRLHFTANNLYAYDEELVDKVVDKHPEAFGNIPPGREEKIAHVTQFLEEPLKETVTEDETRKLGLLLGFPKDAVESYAKNADFDYRYRQEMEKEAREILEAEAEGAPTDYTDREKEIVMQFALRDEEGVHHGERERLTDFIERHREEVRAFLAEEKALQESMIEEGATIDPRDVMTDERIDHFVNTAKVDAYGFHYSTGTITADTIAATQKIYEVHELAAMAAAQKAAEQAQSTTESPRQGLGEKVKGFTGKLFGGSKEPAKQPDQAAPPGTKPAPGVLTPEQIAEILASAQWKRDNPTEYRSSRNDPTYQDPLIRHEEAATEHAEEEDEFSEPFVPEQTSQEQVRGSDTDAPDHAVTNKEIATEETTAEAVDEEERAEDDVRTGDETGTQTVPDAQEATTEEQMSEVDQAEDENPAPDASQQTTHEEEEDTLEQTPQKDSDEQDRAGNAVTADEQGHGSRTEADHQEADQEQQAESQERIDPDSENPAPNHEATEEDTSKETPQKEVADEQDHTVTQDDSEPGPMSETAPADLEQETQTESRERPATTILPATRGDPVHTRDTEQAAEPEQTTESEQTVDAEQAAEVAGDDSPVVEQGDNTPTQESDQGHEIE